jgi:hypothetical protein
MMHGMNMCVIGEGAEWKCESTQMRRIKIGVLGEYVKWAGLFANFTTVIS